MTGEPVVRETVLPGAVLTRVAASHIRVGTFQFFAARHDVEGLRLLADHVIQRHYPDAGSYRALFERVIERQAELVAQWLLVGFIHGVMNTDNMSIAGETIDYGPCAFMDAYNPETVFSSIDQYGRYAYGKQPQIAGMEPGAARRSADAAVRRQRRQGTRAGQRSVAALRRSVQCRLSCGYAPQVRPLHRARRGSRARADVPEVSDGQRPRLHPRLPAAERRRDPDRGGGLGRTLSCPSRPRASGRGDAEGGDAGRQSRSTSRATTGWKRPSLPPSRTRISLRSRNCWWCWLGRSRSAANSPPTPSRRPTTSATTEQLEAPDGLLRGSGFQGLGGSPSQSGHRPLRACRASASKWAIFSAASLSQSGTLLSSKP